MSRFERVGATALSAHYTLKVSVSWDNHEKGTEAKFVGHQSSSTMAAKSKSAE